MKQSIFRAGAVLGCLGFVLFFQPLSAAEYEAKIRETTQQGVRTGKLHVGKTGMRTEIEVNGETQVQIVNFDRREVILVKPAQKAYMRRALPPTGPIPGRPDALANRSANPCEGQQGLLCEPLGEEVVQERKAIKWSVAPKTGGQDARMTIWLDRERNIPLQQQLPNGATMTRRLLGEETVNRRKAEKWETMLTGPDGKTARSFQWFDPALGANIREEQAGSYTRDLLDIRPGPQSASLFTVQDDFKEVRPAAGEGERIR